MSIKKAKNLLKHNKLNFTTILNEVSQGIRHTGAAGVYMYLASKPEDWEICKTELARHFQCGLKHINTCWKKLKEYGLIRVIAHRDNKGKISFWETVLNDRIYIKPEPLKKEEVAVDKSRIPILDNVDKRQCGKGTITKERDLQNKDSLKKKDSNTNDDYFLYDLFRDEIGDKTLFRGHVRNIIKIHIQHKGMTLRESLINSVTNLKNHMRFTSVEKPAALFIDIIKKDKYFGDTKYYTRSKKK